MGFEFGYSLDAPDALVAWEAQFGDFANNAQVVIDQYIASSRTRWQQPSDLVLLLPHGYEGQGAEHSSARLERYLQLCAERNMTVCNFTTPANYFHALRRQLKRNYRKPLVVMTPKSLLRHKLAVSSLADFGPGSAGGFGVGAGSTFAAEGTALSSEPLSSLPVLSLGGTGRPNLGIVRGPPGPLPGPMLLLSEPPSRTSSN